MCDALFVRPEVVLGLAHYNIDWREQNKVEDDTVVPLPETLQWRIRHARKEK